MRITIVSGSVPTTTFIDNLIYAMADEGMDITVTGKQTGVYHYPDNVSVILTPETLIAQLWFIIRLGIATGFKYWSIIKKYSRSNKGFFKDLLFYLPIIKSDPNKIHIQWTAFIHNRDALFEIFPDRVLVSMRGAHINYTPITTPAIKESYLRLFPKVYRFHAVSQAIANEAVQYNANYDKTDVIYSYVQDSLLEKEIQQKPQRSKLHIISVGRFFWKKGYEYAIDALSILKDNEIPFHYTLVAEGDVPASLMFQLHQCNLKEDVSIINGATHEKVISLIEEHDVLLLSSVEEGIANVVLEAMTVGTPVVTTNAGGMEEVIKNEENGFIVPLRKVSAMADALMKVYEMSSEERYKMAHNAKSFVEGRHNSKTFREKYIEFYSK